MHRFNCMYQDYHGVLCVSASEFYFTSSLFRLNLKWSRIKTVALGTQLIKNVATSVLVIKLHRIPGLNANNFGDTQVSEASRTHIFYRFHDLLSVEEKVKSLWRASRNLSTFTQALDVEHGVEGQEDTASVSKSTTTTPVPSEIHMSSRSVKQRRASGTIQVPSLLNQPTLDGMSLVPLANDSSPDEQTVTQHGYADKDFKQGIQKIAESCHEYGIILLSRPSFLWYILMLLLVLITGVYLFAFNKDRVSDPFLQCQELVQKLEAAKRHKKKINTPTSIPRGERFAAQGYSPLKDIRTWLKATDKVVESLLWRYVELQIEMIDLRQEHVDRLIFQNARGRPFSESEGVQSGISDSPPFLSNDRGRIKVVPKVTHSAKDRTRLFHWTQIKRSSPKLYFILVRVLDLRKVFPAYRQPSPEDDERVGKRVARYVEPFLRGFEITQYVTEEESSERNRCLRISNELLQVSRSIEKLFYSISSFLDEADPRHPFRLSKAERQDESGRHDDIGEAYAIKSAFLYPYASTDDTAHIAFLHRYVDNILLLDPFHRGNSKKRQNNSGAAYKMNLLRELRLKKPYTLNRTTAEELLLLFSAIINPPLGRDHSLAEKAIDTAVGTLRNLLFELEFWDTRKDLWEMHLVASLPDEYRQQLDRLVFTRLQQMHADGKTTANTLLNQINTTIELSKSPFAWRHLPLFKGQLCFSLRPYFVSTLSPLISLPLNLTTRPTNQSSYQSHPIDSDSLLDAQTHFRRGTRPHPLTLDMLFRNAYRNAYDRSYPGPVVSVAKERWLDQLRALSLFFKTATRGSANMRRFAYTLHEFYAVQEFSALWGRLWDVFDRIDRWYIKPFYRKQGFFPRLGFPFRILKWPFGGDSQEAHVKGQSGSLPFGTDNIPSMRVSCESNSDVAFNTAARFLLEPQTLLKFRMQTDKQICVMSICLIIAIAFACVILSFH